MAALWVRNDCPQTGLASRSQEHVVSSYVQPILLGIPLLATGPGWWDQQGMARRLSQSGRLMWAWPALSPLAAQFAYSLALCILPHPRPSAGASTPPRGTVPLQHRFSCSHPCATLPPTHQHPHHRLCTTQYPHSPGLARESSKAWTQALQPPRPACPPQDMHLQVRTWLCSPWCTFQGHPHSHISPHSHAVLPARFCPHKLSLTLSPHLLRPQSAPASPQHLCIQPRVCGHCLGFPRSGCDPPVPPGH